MSACNCTCNCNENGAKFNGVYPHAEPYLQGHPNMSHVFLKEKLSCFNIWELNICSQFNYTDNTATIILRVFDKEVATFSVGFHQPLVFNTQYRGLGNLHLVVSLDLETKCLDFSGTVCGKFAGCKEVEERVCL